MSSGNMCRECGTAIPADSPGGFCAHCLLGLGLEAVQAEDVQGEAVQSPKSKVQSQQTALAGSLTERPGDRIGRYKLLEEIGHGGCGVVYMAEQEEPVRRKVALKVIKLGMDTRQVVARFEAERQALALMDHPNIARVLDAGATDSGRPYFVMELVGGTRITDYCDRHQLTTGQRLDLFVQVCHAVQHAHQKGIIHRDLKPSNVLVATHDRAPVPKVIDFGIAKATQGRLTDQTVFTAFEQFLGTPAYMSPEQAQLGSLDVDTRSDIYSLGVLLYELLTGKTPLDTKELLAAGLDELRRTIREVEPAKPSTRLTQERLAGDKSEIRTPKSEIDKDLDWIVMKCLEKDRARRYETASGLARDIERHLNNEPVVARPPSAAYRFHKLVRRNKLAFAATGAIAAILVVTTLASTWQAIRATRAEELASRRVLEVAAERDEKDKARLAAETARQAAETARQTAEAARQEAEAISTFLTKVFQSPDPARDGRTITVAETLDRGTRKLDTDLASQPARRAKLQTTLGTTYHALGLDRDAIPLLERARDYYLATRGSEHPDTLLAMGNLAISYFAAGRREEALKLREEVLALHRKVNGPEHLETLKSMNNLANSYFATGRREEALKLREEVLALSLKVKSSEHPDTLTSMHNLAISYSDAGRREEALKLREEVLAHHRKVKGQEHPSTLASMNSLATSYYDAGRREEALKLREEVLALHRKVNGPEHPSTLTSMNNLATSYYDAARREEALKLREEVLALDRKLLGAEHPDTLLTMNNLASSYSDAGRREEALKLCEEVLALFRKVNGTEHPDSLLAMGNLASSYSDAGRLEKALKLREEVLALYLKVKRPEHPDTLRAMHNLAVSYSDAGRREEALKLLEEVLALRRKVLGQQHSDTLETMANLANSYRLERRYAEAEPLYREHLQSQSTRYPATNDAVASVTYSLAGLLHDWAWSERGAADKSKAAQRAREAERLLRDCLATRAKTLGPGGSRLAQTRSRLGGALVAIAVIDSTLTTKARLAQFTEAESFLLEAHEALWQNERAEPKSKRDTLERLVRLYQAWDKPEKLLEWQQKLEAFRRGESKSSEPEEEKNNKALCLAG